MTTEQSKEFIDMGYALDNGSVDLSYVLEWLESRVSSISIQLDDDIEAGEMIEYRCDIELSGHPGSYTSWGATPVCAVVHCLTGMTA